MRNALKLLAKNVLITIELTAAASLADAAIQRKSFGSSATTLVFSSKDLNNIIKIVNFLEDDGLLIKYISEDQLDRAGQDF